MKAINTAIVCAPVADLRREPCSGKKNREKDMLQESQLLFGERVSIVDEHGDWVRIICGEQPRFWEGRWGGYSGWALREQLFEVEQFENNLIVSRGWANLYEKPSANSTNLLTVPLGSCLQGVNCELNWWKIWLPRGHVGFIAAESVRRMASLSEIEIREGIVTVAKTFLKSPYLWGGRSSYKPGASILTGVDCSGLVNLLYRVHGMMIPRDAHDQFLKATPKNPEELKPGDLLFMSGAEKSSRISHVMIVAGGDLLLESAMQPNCVREIACHERFGHPLISIVHGGQVGELRLWCGSLLRRG
jgi:hypothetical protein